MSKTKPEAISKPSIDFTKVEGINLPVQLKTSAPAKKQQIHFLSLKASSTDGYEQALNALQGKIVTMTTTNEHLIVITA